jgi:sugar lactone lactonase YvrE/enterochelin esterase-like enzyme
MKLRIFACLLTAALSPARAADDYTLGPDSLPQEGVPRGDVFQHQWKSSIFPGTERDYWVYVPQQYSSNKPANVMIFQDGASYINPNGSYRVPTVFDNLIHKGELPVTIGIFINPGEVPAVRTNALRRYNRSFEYDGLGDRYARFLLEEILPEVGKSYRLATNASNRAIGGASSGAIAAFTAAWERPDAFGRVFSTIGTYVGLRGGNNYPTLIRKTEPKPIRIFLQDGTNDLNIYGGNWFIANEDMLSALQFAGYAVTNVWGDGGHNGKHGGAIFPDAMRWLWADEPKATSGTPGNRHPTMDLLLPGEGWKLVSAGHRFTEGPAANRKGELFFTDIPNNRIHKVNLNGRVEVFAEDTGGANGLAFDPDGNLLACANSRKEIVKYMPDGTSHVVVTNANSNDIAVTSAGDFYFTDPGNKKVWHSTAAGQARVVDEGIARPNGVVLTPDQSLLLVADTAGQMVYSFQILADGSLTNKQPYFHLHLSDAATQSGADGMTVDNQGRLYVTTTAGIQVCDQAGRVNAILAKPQNQWLANAAFGGPELDMLFVTCGDKVYRRKMRVKGVNSYDPPFAPPRPRL